ncbi:dual specificity protein kinase splB-like [Mytilus trossulus]|uniref:dual specificity protein kinase splB-like n=1 Tax=Mytilus trossulus TaxID=6551 RepID=UPI0030051B34
MPGYYADNAYNRRIGRAGLPKGSMPVSREGVFLAPRTYTSNSYTRLDRDLSQFSMLSGFLNSSRSSDSDSGFGSSSSSSFSSPRQNPSHSDGGTSFSSPRQNTFSDSPSRFTAHLRDSSFDSGLGSPFSSPFSSPQRTPDRSWFDEYTKWTQLKIHEEGEKIASKHEQQWQVMNLTDEILMRELQQLQLEEIEKWTEFKMKTEKEKEDICQRNQHENLHRRKEKFSLNLVERQQEEMEKWTIWQSKVEYEAERKKRQKHDSEINTPASEFHQFCQRPADETWTGLRNPTDQDNTDEMPNNQVPNSFCYQQNPVYETPTNANLQTPTDETGTRWRNPTDQHTTDVMPNNQGPFSYQENTVDGTTTNVNLQSQCGNQALLGQMPESTLMSQHHESTSGFQNTTKIGQEYQETMRFIHTGIENFDLQSNIADENMDNTLNTTTGDRSPHSDFTDDDYLQNSKPSMSYQVSSPHYMAGTNRLKPVQKKKKSTTNYDASSSYLKSRRKSNDHGKEIRFSHPEQSLNLQTSAINERQFKNLRHKALNDRKDMTKQKSKIESYTMKGYTGIVVDFEKIEMIQTLSVQGLCKKHIARWNDTVVVSKMIDVHKVSERTTTKFQDEILLSSAIEHSNIVKYLGASIVHPNLCILTEFMQTNLYEALHIEENIKFLEKEKIKIIQQVASGLEYLHKKDMSHFNLETRNVLLDYTPGSSLVAKLSDFSHSVKIMNETEEKYMRSDQNSRYSAPEVLCEDYVNMKFLKMADVYSFSLIIFEVIFEQEPFQTLDISEAAKQIRESGLTPTIPRNVCVNKTLLSFIMSGWNRDPTQRPTIRHFANYCLGMDHIFTKSNTQDKDITIYFYFCLCFIGFLSVDEFIFDIMSTCSIVMLFMFVLSCIILFRSSNIKLTNTRC